MGTTRWPCVIFDLDGTVADTIELIIASYDYALNTVLGLRLEPAELRLWIGRTLGDVFGERWPDHTEELIDTYRVWNQANTAAMVAPYPGISELLTDLAQAGITVGLATSKRRGPADHSLQVAGVDLAVTVAAEDTTRHKPNPDPLLLAQERLGMSGAATVYVGDAVVDVQAARAAGMDSIAVTWGAGELDALTDIQPTALASTVAELRTLLLE